MHKKLEDIYQTMLTEEHNKMTAGNVKPGELEGSEKAKPIAQQSTTDNGVDAPKEGPSQTEVKKGGATANSKAAKGEEVSVKDSFDAVTSRFESLYKSVIGEDFDELSNDGEDDVVEAPEIEGDNFDEEIGDFDDEGDVSEETDFAVELRTMSDRMLELADKFAELSGEGDNDDLNFDAEDEEDEDELFGAPKMESVKSEPEPKTLKKTSYGPKMSKTVKGKLSSVGKKKAVGSIKGSHTGEPEKFGDKSKKNQSGMTVGGKGPAQSGKNADAFCK